MERKTRDSFRQHAAAAAAHHNDDESEWKNLMCVCAVGVYDVKPTPCNRHRLIIRSSSNKWNKQANKWHFLYHLTI